MKRGLLIGAIFILGVWTPAVHANKIMECEATGISGLWPDGAGGWYGSSKLEWNQCADGNSYVATCNHQGSGLTMGSCLCRINGCMEYESNCKGLISTSDLGEASLQCCSYFDVALVCKS